jgi:MoaA/NifB/PqqE/SkfB family radical SAM enzyme
MKPFRLLNKFGKHIGTMGEIISPIVDNRLVPYPFIMNWVVTRRCNSRCQMCNIWQDKQSVSLTFEQAENIFSKNDFSFVRSLTFTGGEPTLRKDLLNLFQLTIDSMENLYHLQLATHGLHTSKVITIVKGVFDYLNKRKRNDVALDIQISLDGIGDVHNTIRGIPTFFDKVQDTIRELKILQNQNPNLNIKISSVLMPYNLPYVAELKDYAEENNLPIHFSPVVFSNQYYENTQFISKLALTTEEDLNSAIKFFNTLGKEDQTSLRFYYQDVGRILAGLGRGRRCMMGFYGFTLEYDGNVFPCVNCEEKSFGNLLNDNFENIWFGNKSDLVRTHLRASCCSTCTSMCYPNEVNLIEKLETLWRGRNKP